MNTLHFDNIANKIGILQTYKHPTAGTADKLATARTIGGTSFDGSANIAVGLAATATKLATARLIGGTSFDGSADISVGLASTATTATKLATARTIGGTSFDGSANIAVGLASTATILATTRAIAGVNFDGSAAISIPYENLTFKPTAGTGIAITAGSSVLSPIISATSQAPTSASLVGILNTSQFTNNVGTSRVDIATGFKPTTAGTADAVPYSGITGIPTTWTDTQIPSLTTAKITSGTFDVPRIPDLGTSKITSGTFDVLRIPDLGTSKITSGTFDVLRIPDLGTSKITSGTFDILRIPDLGTSKITSGTFDVLRIPSLATSKITSGTFADSFIPTLAQSKISGLSTSLGQKQNSLTSTTLDITNSLTPGESTTINIGSYSYASLANKPTAGSAILISSATPPVISVNYNTSTLQLDATGKLNVIPQGGEKGLKQTQHRLD
jgi:hypothetical protein